MYACINLAQINSQVTDVKWPKGTVVIVGDSIMSRMREEFLKTDKHNVKVRFFIGGTIEDMEDNVKPIFQREPYYIILHLGTNNATNLMARDKNQQFSMLANPVKLLFRNLLYVLTMGKLL